MQPARSDGTGSGKASRDGLLKAIELTTRGLRIADDGGAGDALGVVNEEAGRARARRAVPGRITRVAAFRTHRKVRHVRPRVRGDAAERFHNEGDDSRVLGEDGIVVLSLLTLNIAPSSGVGEGRIGRTTAAAMAENEGAVALLGITEGVLMAYIASQ